MSVQDQFEFHFSKEQLKEHYSSSIAFTAAIGHDKHNHQSFGRELSHQIDIIHRKSIAGTYTFTKYRQKLFSKGVGKAPREISIPTIRDRLVLRTLHCFLSDRFAGDAHQPLPQILVKEAYENYTSGQYDAFIKLDVTNFYPSINHAKLLKTLNRRLKHCPTARDMIVRAITTPTVSKPHAGDKPNGCGVPQGLAISNVLASIYLSSIDKHYRQQGNLKYCRYVDDVLILCRLVDADAIAAEAIKRFKRLKLTVHDPKAHSSKSSKGQIGQAFSFLGYSFEGARLTVRNSTIDRLRESIISTLTAYQHAKKKNESFLVFRLNLRITGCVFENKAKGWLFYFSEINDEGLLHQLDSFVGKMLSRFGLPHIKAKRFVRAMYDITYRKFESTYVPNYDRYAVEDMRKFFQENFSLDLTGKSDDEVKDRFLRKIKRETKELQNDLGTMS